MNTIERSAIHKEGGEERSRANDIEKGDSLGGDNVTGEYSNPPFDICS
jgi:hypothetical protein